MEATGPGCFYTYSFTSFCTDPHLTGKFLDAKKGKLHDAKEQLDNKAGSTCKTKGNDPGLYYPVIYVY